MTPAARSASGCALGRASGRARAAARRRARRLRGGPRPRRPAGRDRRAQDRRPGQSGDGPRSGGGGRRSRVPRRALAWPGLTAGARAQGSTRGRRGDRRVALYRGCGRAIPLAAHRDRRRRRPGDRGDRARGAARRAPSAPADDRPRRAGGGATVAALAHEVDHVVALPRPNGSARSPSATTTSIRPPTPT